MVQGYSQKNSGSLGGWCSFVFPTGIRAFFSCSGAPVRYSPSNLGNLGKALRVLPVRISVELTLINGLHILQKNLDYLGLYRLIPKLEGIC